MFLLGREDGVRKDPVAGGSLEFQELGEGLSGWESQSKGEIARNEAGAVGGAIPHWALCQVQESQLTCPAAHMSRMHWEGRVDIGLMTGVSQASPPHPAPSTQPGSQATGVSTPGLFS